MEKLSAYSLMCLVLMAASGAFAQEGNPCAGDIGRFCSNIEPGKGRVAECLKQNEAQLSSGCRMQHLTEISEVLSKTQDACKSDSVAYCGSFLQQQGEPLLKCLKLNAPSLSPDCREELFKALDLMHY